MSSNSTVTMDTPFLTSNHLTPLIVGSWLAVLFLTAQVFLLGKYFSSKNGKSDHWLLKFGLIIDLLANLAGTAASCAATYLYTVSYWGNEDKLAQRKWPVFVVVFATGVVVAISQLFMIVRYLCLTRHYSVFCFIFVIYLASVAGIIATGILLIILPDFETNDLTVIFFGGALVGTTLETFLTTLLMFIHRKREGSDYLSPQSIWPKRFVRGLIETGALMLVLVVVGFATAFGPVSEWRVWIPCGMLLAPVYACTMLHILCMRPEPAPEPIMSQTPFTRPFTRTIPSATVMEDSDAFRLTRKRMALFRNASKANLDSSSDVSRNLNNELDDMEKGVVRHSDSDSSDYEEEEADGESAYDEEIRMPRPPSDEDDIVLGQHEEPLGELEEEEEEEEEEEDSEEEYPEEEEEEEDEQEMTESEREYQQEPREDISKYYHDEPEEEEQEEEQEEEEDAFRIPSRAATPSEGEGSQRRMTISAPFLTPAGQTPNW